MLAFRTLGTDGNLHVVSLAPGGVAESDGRLQVGDHITEINGVRKLLAALPET